MAEDQRVKRQKRKKKVAKYNRLLAWLTVPMVLIGTFAFYAPDMNIDLPPWINIWSNTLFVIMFFIHGAMSAYLFGVPKPRKHIRVIHIYIGYLVFIFVMVSQSLLGVEPIHNITYILSWIFIIAHVALSTRFMLKRVNKQESDLLNYFTGGSLVRDAVDGES